MALVLPFDESSFRPLIELELPILQIAFSGTLNRMPWNKEYAEKPKA